MPKLFSWLLGALLSLSILPAFGQYCPHQRDAYCECERQKDRQALDSLLRSPKVNAQLKQHLLDRQHRTPILPQRTLRVSLQGNTAKLEAAVEHLGGRVNTRLRGLLTAQVRYNDLPRLIESPALARLSSYGPGQALNDSAIVRVEADHVQQGLNLPRAYKGEDVIVGIIDTGIDYKHGAFRDPQDSTQSRILRIWDQQSSEGATPDGFSYGSEWTRQQLNQELGSNPAGVVTHEDNLIGHGTHVAGTAAGNFGIAPHADIVACAVDLQSFAGFFTSILDAVHYIYQVAEAEGKPCVINASLGRLIVPPNGTTPMDQGIQQMVDTAAGRVFVAANGNDGGTNQHWGGFPLQPNQARWVYSYAPLGQLGTSDTLGYQFVVPDSKLSSFELQLVADSADLSDLGGLTGGGTPEPVAPIDSTNYIQLAAIAQSGSYDTTFFYGNGDTASAIRMTSSALANQNKRVFNVRIRDYQTGSFFGIEGMDLYQLRLRGNASAGIHVLADYNGEFLRDTAFAAGALDSLYRNPDDRFNVASPAAGPGALAVGAYKNKVHAGQTGNTPYDVGALSNFSSKGPTSDGRIKPEITAPGENVESAIASNAIFPVSRTTQFGEVGFQSGTSMASPVVAGGVALLLQARPDATHHQIEQWIVNNAKTDQYTSSAGSLPNGAWGHGKLDLHSAMQQAAQGVSRLGAEAGSKGWRVNPNPVRRRLHLQREGAPIEAGTRLRILNANGQTVHQQQIQKLQAGVAGLSLPVDQLSKGVYMLQIRNTAEPAVLRFVKQ